MSQAEVARQKLLGRASKLWGNNYEHHCRHELTEVPDLVETCMQVYAAQTSTYRARLTDKRLIARYDEKTAVSLRDTVTVLRRRRNQFDIPFLVDARSLSYFNQRVPKRVWKDQQAGLRIIHRDGCKILLDAMLEVQPKPPFLENDFVSVFGVDQCNFWQAAQNSKKGQFRGAERLNEQGMPILIRSETVLNIVQRQIPFTAPMLTSEEIKEIREKGPYTEDFGLVKQLLNPRAIAQSETEWMVALMCLLGGVGATTDADSEDGLPGGRSLQLPTTEREVTERVLGKPVEKPPRPTFIKIHPAVPKCETQSFLDVQKMWAALLMYMTASCICCVIFCDGQLVDLLRTCKRKYTAEYKRILIANGAFHSFAHLIFCLNEGYWWCCCCTFALWQGKRKQIYHHMADLQHDNFRHCLDFHRVNTAGILAYLTLDVVHPPPSLLIRDPKAYSSLVRNAGGIVLLKYLEGVGSPILQFQRVTRAGKGDQITGCLAFAFHCHRCFATKFKSVYICMTALIGLRCAHPKLVKVLEECTCLSFLGRIYIAYDRFLENVNDMQLKRGTAFRSFDEQLHFSEYLQPLVHVDQAWKEANANGTGGNDDGITSHLHNDVAEMRRMLRLTLGTNLMTYVPGNALWHTGNAVPLDGVDYRERTPWEWRDQVAEGNSRGEGRANPMSWRRFVDDFLANHWWPQSES
jgi:hypothetical protein